jgi:hypothetical protein
VQQEPVHSDNPVLRNSIRDTLRKLFSENSQIEVIKEIEDFILPTLVVAYYTEGSSVDFLEYLKKIDIKDDYYQSIIQRINVYLKNLPSNTDKILLGDLHPGNVSKYLNNGKIEYSNYPDYGDFLRNIAALILDDCGEFFPEIMKNGKQFSRSYIETKLEAETQKDVENFYKNLGRVIPIILSLRSVDINAENMIVHLPYPVFFDMESLMSGNFESDLGDYGIRNTGIVKIEEKNDSSALTGGLFERESLLKPLICGTPQKPYIGWRTKSKGRYFNIPVLNGIKVNPAKYLKYLKNGFYESVERILINLS